jgi:hypothetical protein
LALAVILPAVTDEVFRAPAGILGQLVNVPNLQLLGFWNNNLRKGQGAASSVTTWLHTWLSRPVQVLSIPW